MAQIVKKGWKGKIQKEGGAIEDHFMWPCKLEILSDGKGKIERWLLQL